VGERVWAWGGPDPLLCVGPPGSSYYGGVSLSPRPLPMSPGLALRSLAVSWWLVFTWGTAVLAAEPAAPATKPAAPATKPAAPQTTLEDVVAKLRKSGKASTATRLLAAVDSAKAERQKLDRGRVVVGRVTLEGGPGRLDQLTSQVSFVADGWFVTLADSVLRPISLRLHGYEAVDIPLQGLGDAEVLVVGELSLSPLPLAKLAAVRGRVVAADPKARIQAYGFIGPGVQNTIGTTVSGDRPATRLNVKLEKDGSFLLEGLSPHPARYEFWFKAPGLTSESRSFTPQAEVTHDLGEIRLEKLRRLRVRYMLSSAPPPFQDAKVQEATVQLGQSFKADPSMKDVTFLYEQRQKGERLRFPKQPVRIASLGKGKLEDFRAVKPEGLKLASIFEVGFEPGQVYLLDHRGVSQWILFTLEPAASETP
jgi:hypothetical protein